MFLNTFMPTLPWWFLVAALTALASWLVTVRTRLWKAQQRRIDARRRAWLDTRDALAALIADPAVFGETREKALKAYDSVSKMIGSKGE